jgi:dihydrofolate synthase/folylpolyglutamate synthase
MMTEFEEWMYGFGMNRMRFGLENITELLKRLGDPQNDFRSVHVAGSDGKGSTCAMIYSSLLTAGIRAGMYTSPHMIRFNERISVNGNDIENDDLDDLMRIVRPVADEMLYEGKECTFFEVGTALAFLHFSRMGSEYAVIETGMGGRLDATNVLKPEITAITNISLEHTDILGDTKEKIAYEKAGIIKSGVPVVTANRGSVLKVIRDAAEEKGSEVIAISADDIEITSFMNGKASVRYSGKEYEIGIPGRHQAENAAIAIECLKHMGISEHAAKGLRNTSWKGRMEYFPERDAVVDMTHTAAGAERLAEDMSDTYGKVILILGLFDDKNADPICRSLSEIASEVIIAAPGSDRAMDPGILADIMKKYTDNVSIAPNAKEAINSVLEKENRRTLLITGSLSMAGEAAECLRR